MAPNKRKKMGLTRMDAALDQMSNFGFDRQLVRKTVRNLLKLYGEEGWKLIEEDGYKVLLDVILDEQETAQTNNLLKYSSSLLEIENPENKLVNAESNKVVAEDALPTNNADSNEVPLLENKGVTNDKGLMDNVLDKIALQSSPLYAGKEDHFAEKVNLQFSENALLSGCSSNAGPTRKRKPCYGWISDDEDDADDIYFIELKPST